VVEIQHRFYGLAFEDPVNTFFGTTSGTAIGIGSHIGILPNACLHVNYTKSAYSQEYILGGSYQLPTSLLGSVQAGLDLIHQKPQGLSDRQNTVFVQMTGELPITMTFLESLTLRNFCINLAYDGYTKKMGGGYGFHIPVSDDLYFVWETIFSTGVSGPKDSIAFGLSGETFGHHFKLLLQNQPGIGLRQCLMGSTTNDLSLGFTIERQFE